MDDRKTIWCISKYASPPNYGVGARLFYIAREFSRLGNETLIISSDSNHLAKYPHSHKVYNEENYGKLKHIWIKTVKYTRSASLKRFLSWFDFEMKLFMFPHKKYPKPDIVIVSSLSIFTIIYGMYLKKKYNCKLVFEIRDIHPLTLTEEFGVSKYNPFILFLGLIEKIGYRSSDLIVGTMPNLRQHVEETIQSKKDVFFSPLGIHERWFKEHPINASIDELFPNDKKFIIGYAGSMGISNALNNFIEAIEKLRENKEIHFVLVGDGDLKKEFINRLSNCKNVTIGPKINQNDVPYFLSKCDLLYLSTHDSKIWDYGQSLNKLIDYMMSGKPVIASYSGYQSMLNEANSGLFIPTNDTDAIIEAIYYFKEMPPEEIAKWGSRGKQWVEINHKYENIAQNYLDRLKKL